MAQGFGTSRQFRLPPVPELRRRKQITFWTWNMWVDICRNTHILVQSDCARSSTLKLGRYKASDFPASVRLQVQQGFREFQCVNLWSCSHWLAWLVPDITLQRVADGWVEWSPWCSKVAWDTIAEFTLTSSSVDIDAFCRTFQLLSDAFDIGVRPKRSRKSSTGFKPGTH